MTVDQTRSLSWPHARPAALRMPSRDDAQDNRREISCDRRVLPHGSRRKDQPATQDLLSELCANAGPRVQVTRYSFGDKGEYRRDAERGARIPAPLGGHLA